MLELIKSYPVEQDYDDFIKLVKDTKMVHEIFYEMLFYVPGKTQNPKLNKCKSRPSRTTCFKLIFNLAKTFKPKEMNEFISEYVWDMIKDLRRPEKWQYEPSQGRSQDSPYAGIKNLGNICYMISMLQ